MIKPIRFSGTLTAIATPFSSDGVEVDYQSLGKLLDFQIQKGVQGVVACGSTGEAAALSDDEYQRVVRFTIDHAAGRYQVVAGIGSNNVQRAREMARFLAGQKLDGILCVTPPYSKPPQSGLIEFFRAVKAELPQPLIAYNVPGRTGINLLPATVAQLAKEGTIVALKDSAGSIEQLLETQRLLEKPIDILSGEDALISASMACGATGTISATANIIPGLISAITAAGLRGDYEGSYREQLKALPVVRAAFLESNPIPVKYGLFHLGVIKSPHVRLPLLEATTATQGVLKEVLAPWH